MGQIFGIGKSSGQTFGGLEVGRLKNGSFVIKGDHHEQYMKDYYDSESLVREPVDREVVVETVAPSQIEGVDLSERDLDDPDGFWSMHASSESFFQETAAHIPDVQAALDGGRTVEELKSDPVLGTCAATFFDPARMPRVEKWDGYYCFDGDGRHRIITARKLGCDIPVRITGIRRHK